MFYRWRQIYGDIKVPEDMRLHELEQENSRLKRIVAERDLEIDVMKDVLLKTGDDATAAGSGHLATFPGRFPSPQFRPVRYQQKRRGLSFAASFGKKRCLSSLRRSRKSTRATAMAACTVTSRAERRAC